MLKGIKAIVKSSLASDPLQVLFWGHPTLQTFTDSLAFFAGSQPSGQASIVKRAIKKLGKQKQAPTALSILYFLDMILDAGYHINLEGLNPTICTEDLSEKQRVAAMQVIKLYAEFLNLKSKKKKTMENRKIRSEREIGLKEQIEPCQYMVTAILNVISKDFVLHYCNDKLKNLDLIKQLVLISIMAQISSSLKQLSRFIQNNWKAITTQTQLAFRINNIYEKTLFISKQKAKLNSLNQKCKRNLVLEFYEFDSKINHVIEKQMQDRAQQKKQFFSERLLAKEQTNFQELPYIQDNLSEDNVLLVIEEE